MGKLLLLLVVICALPGLSLAIEYRTSPGTIEKVGKYLLVNKFEKTSFEQVEDKEKCPKYLTAPDGSKTNRRNTRCLDESYKDRTSVK